MSSIHARRLAPPRRPVSIPGTPWTRLDAATTALLIAVGALLWTIGWYRVANKPSMGDQIAPLNLTVVGLAVIGAGQVLWFLRGRRIIDERRRALLGDEPAPVAADAPADGELFTGAYGLYHRQACAMVTDRDWAPTARVAHESAGRAPCGVCAP